MLLRDFLVVQSIRPIQPDWKICSVYWNLCKMHQILNKSHATSPFRLCRQAYEMLFIQSEAEKENWASQVKQVLTRSGFGLVWLCQDVGNERSFLVELKDRMIACFKQNWHSKIKENEKYTWFYSFKNISQPEMYLSSLTNKWHRSIFARFRNRTLGLNGHKKLYNDKNADNLCCFYSDRNKRVFSWKMKNIFCFTAKHMMI